MADPIAPQRLVQFVVDEARTLNDGAYRRWLELFDTDGHYWVPLGGDRQADPVRHASIAYDDRLLLGMRIERLERPRAHSVEQGVRSLHVIHLPQVDPSDPQSGEHRLYTPFVYTELAGPRKTMLTGVWRHRLRDTAAGLRIVEKRVDLLDASAAHEAIQLFP